MILFDVYYWVFNKLAADFNFSYWGSLRIDSILRESLNFNRFLLVNSFLNLVKIEIRKCGNAPWLLKSVESLFSCIWHHKDNADNIRLGKGVAFECVDGLFICERLPNFPATSWRESRAFMRAYDVALASYAHVELNDFLPIR